MFGKNFPKVEKGSVIVIPVKTTKPKRERQRNPNTGLVLQKAVTGAIGAVTSVLTLYLLYLTVKNTNK
jgi:hypothetical protein